MAKIKMANAKSTSDILIEDIKKADIVNNSDLVVIQKLAGETETTSIQEIRNKILNGTSSTGGDIGQFLFLAAPTNNENYQLMDGSVGNSIDQLEFYNWLILQNNTTKTFFSLDEVTGTFIFTNINDGRYFKSSNTSISKGGVNWVNAGSKHYHNISGSYENQYWVDQKTVSPSGNQRRVLIDYGTSRSGSITYSDGTTIPKENEPNYFTGFVYIIIRTLSSTVSSPFVKTDGTVAMNNDYIPSDPLDVATKRYIDSKFMNYEIPVSFSINEIGERVNYYDGIESRPELIALDGTKYLISDYPDFDYDRDGFTNDGVYFWFIDYRLDIKTIIQNTQEGNKGRYIDGYIDVSAGTEIQIFNSKLIYNFLQTPKGNRLLVADGVGKEFDNYGFTILNPTTYQIRMNVFRNGDTFPNANERILLGRSVGQDALLPFFYGNFAQGTPTGNCNITAVKYLLKIQPDYMVARIQQVGSLVGTGDLKSDRSVKLTGVGSFNTKDITSMDDLKSQNIIVSNTARAIVTLDSKLNSIDNSITQNTNNIATINSNIGSVNISSLKTQTDTNTNKITALESIGNTIYKFPRKLIRTQTTNLTIAGNSSKRILDDVVIDTSSPYFDSTSFTLEGTTNKVIKEKDNDYKELAIAVTLSHTGNMNATKLEVQLWRNTPTPTLVRLGNQLDFNDPDTRGNTSQILTFKAGLDDPYVTNGYYIILRNLTGTALTYSKVDVLITVAKDRLLG